MIPQHGAFVFGPEQTTTLQDRNGLVDEHVQLVREIRRHNVETIAAAGLEPELHVIGKLVGCANERAV